MIMLCLYSSPQYGKGLMSGLKPEALPSRNQSPTHGRIWRSRCNKDVRLEPLTSSARRRRSQLTVTVTWHEWTSGPGHSPILVTVVVDAPAFGPP